MPNLNLWLSKPEWLNKALFDRTGDYGRLGSQIGAIHAIAQGMKSICTPGNPNTDKNIKWNFTISGIDSLVFSKKVQGSLDKDIIANGIQVDGGANDQIRKKARWLQEWIREASDEDLRNFLKFTTGVSAFPQRRKISVTSQYVNYYPAPKAHTCSFEIELSPENCEASGGAFNDHTKENFIKSLKEIALTDLSGYGQA